MVPITDYLRSVRFYTEGLALRLIRGREDIGWGLLEGENGCQPMIDCSILSPMNAATVVYYYTANLEEVRARVVVAGYAAEPIEETFYGMTEFRTQDPDGNKIWVGAAKQEAI